MKQTAWERRLTGAGDTCPESRPALEQDEPAEVAEMHATSAHRAGTFLWKLVALVLGVGAFVLACMMLAQRAHAAEIGVHALTFHNGGTMPGPAGRPVRLRTFTPGLYVRADNGAAAGFFSNSFGDPVAWAGFVPAVRLSPRLEASVKLGAIAGYRHDPLMPAAIPSLRVTVFGDHAVRFAYLARKPGEPDGVDAVHLIYARAWK